MPPVPEMAPLLLTVTQVAEMLQISRGKAYELVTRGIIPSVRFDRSVRVPLNALQDWIGRQVRRKA